MSKNCYISKFLTINYFFTIPHALIMDSFLKERFLSEVCDHVGWVVITTDDIYWSLIEMGIDFDPRQLLLEWMLLVAVSLLVKRGEHPWLGGLFSSGCILHHSSCGISSNVWISLVDMCTCGFMQGFTRTWVSEK